MINPWLNIPASDYEGHMSSPNVGQLSFLAKTFKESLENHDCRTVALLGCATGNGLEYIKNEVSHRVTAVDINPEYLKILQQRYGDSIPGLEIVRDDLHKCQLEEKAYTLIFAGLVFEYLDPQVLLRKRSINPTSGVRAYPLQDHGSDFKHCIRKEFENPVRGEIGKIIPKWRF
jgi:trans-aconitate methyltransferase